ncbi:cation:proton antiporter [Ferribacterium limneticum]|uniref:cation:proton antiporter n=1 Tax=Ferribacterium limneticum TaxID=76259 RepID=UPI001CF8A14E|nr:cation:proton antiporter [Ferribacterium limneticum]UCV21298.1 cation:proton antiporter [Ferribacterium limneticum]
MFNSIQLFGLVLLGGLAAGEVSRRVLALPRTTGYVLFGLLVGQSGLNWVTHFDIESAQLFIDLALGLILFELGYLVPRSTPESGRNRLLAGCAISLMAGLLVLLLFLYWGFSTGSALFAAALCVATSPAITIATCSDVGAKGERTGLLYTMVAINGAVAFAAVVLLVPFLVDSEPLSSFARVSSALGSIIGSIFLGGACAGLVLLGADRLERQAEHQHLLILGTIVLGVGTAIYLDISVFLPMLIFGILVSTIDRDHKVIAIRIASDARVFLVITFVLAGAALDIAYLRDYWLEAILIALARLAGQVLAILISRKSIGLTVRESIFLGIGLQPMSSIALVLLVNTQMLYSGMDAQLVGMLMATILLMQLFGPLATQTAIKGFGEATRLRPSVKNEVPAEHHGGTS